MSSTQALVTQFVALSSMDERAAFLSTHQHAITPAFFEELKSHSDRLALEDPHRALDLAGHMREAADTLEEPLPSAVACWAQGNALLCLGRYEEALASYQSAIPPYESAGDLLAVGRLQTNTAGVLKNLARYDEALSALERAQHTLRPWRDSRYMAALEMNQGSVYRLLGRYPESLESYARGRAIFETLDNEIQVARMDINRARVLVYLDRFGEAETLLRSAMQSLSAAGKQLPTARAQLNLATLLSKQGLHRQALEHYRQARAAFQALGVDTEVAVVDLYTTYDYLVLNLLPEAHETAIQSQEVFGALAMPRYQALAGSNRAVAARKLGRYEEALAELDIVRTTFSKRNVAAEVARIDVERATTLLELGEYAEANIVAQEALQVLSCHELPLWATEAQIVCAESLLRMNKGIESADLYQNLRERSDLPATLKWRIYAGLGQIAEIEGDLHRALLHYQEAIASIEWVEELLETAEFRAGFLDDKLPIYHSAVQVALELDELDTAYRLSVQAKSGVWRDALSISQREAYRSASLEALRQQWRWLYNQLTRPEEDEGEDLSEPKRSGGQYAARWSHLQELERQMGQEYRASASRLPHHISLPQSEVRGRIPQDTVLLDYYCTAEEIHLFLVTNSEVHTFPGITSTIAVERLVNQWRFNLDSMRIGTSEARQVLDLADQAYTILQHLDDLLIAPVREYLEGYQHLWIVPHGLLWEIPFAALYDGERCLIDRWQLMIIPGWVEGTGEKISAQVDLLGKPVVVGHTDRGRLQYTLEEARTVAAMVDTSPLIEEAATVARVQEEVGTCTLLHVATHGWFRSDAPLFSVIHLADGAVTVKDLETWDMPAIQLVTLSACETGRSLNRGSDLLGISRSLFKAGARRLLVSLWAVDDVATTELMVRFYQRLRAEESLAAAWQAAQRAALAKYRHPFYWAGFILLSLA